MKRNRPVSSLVLALAFALPACEKKADSVTAEPASKPAETAITPAAPEVAAAPAEPQQPKAPPGLPAPADVATPPKDAQKTASGLVTKVITPSTEKEKQHPTDNDQVKVHYTGWTKDGKMFDSSVQRGEPTQFGVTQVIPGWTEALKLMVVGETRRLWIPGKLAYGDTPRMGAPAGDLTFNVELLQILAPPKTPEDVAKAPKTATKTTSGIAYRVLQKGTGKAHPAPTDKVTVHYSGWTTDGKMFDSSVTRGQPTTFGLNQVIPGWTEGVQLMVEGEKTRFWIPGTLAYGDKPSRPGAPAGMLVFDIELLQIRQSQAPAPQP